MISKKQFLLILLIFLFACSYTSNSSSDKEEKGNNVTKKTVFKSQKLFDVLHQEIIEQDSLGRYVPVFMIVFSCEPGNDYIYIIRSLLYSKINFKGHIIVNEKLVAFYVDEEDCELINEFVFLDKLALSVSESFGYFGQRFEDPVPPPFDPYFKKYKEINGGLELIDEGMMVGNMLQFLF